MDAWGKYMATPLLTTKLYIPPLRPELVSRPRLIERMSQVLPHGVIILFPEWNDIHELQTRLLTAVPLTHPMWDYWKGHKDELWERLPAAGS